MIKHYFNILEALGSAKKINLKEVYPHHFIYTYFYNNVEIWAFISYSKLICLYAPTLCQIAIDNNNWDCSKTTCKYFAKFINEYTYLDYDNKYQFMGLLMNPKAHNIEIYETVRWHH